MAYLHKCLQIGRTSATTSSPYSMNGNIPVGFLFLSSFEDVSTITKFKGVPENKATIFIVYTEFSFSFSGKI